MIDIIVFFWADLIGHDVIFGSLAMLFVFGIGCVFYNLTN